MELKNLSKKIDKLLEKLNNISTLDRKLLFGNQNLFIIELLKRKGYIRKDFMGIINLDRYIEEELEECLSLPDKMLQHLKEKEQDYIETIKAHVPEELQKELLDKKVIFIDEQGEWHINREILNVKGGEVNENGNL